MLKNQLAKSADGEYIIINTPYAEAYIPYDGFSNSPDKGGNPVSYSYGDMIRTVGLFNIKFFDNDEVDRKEGKLYTFNYPNVITMIPTDKSEVSTLRLDNDMDEEKYLICKFYKGDAIMSTKIMQSSQNCEAFMDLLTLGKLPKGLSYDELFFAWMKNFEINGVDPGVPSVVLQMMLSENCRSKEDSAIQFRKVVNDKNTTPYDYRVGSMVDICSNSSVFNALAFERYKEMLTSAITMSNNGTEQNTTPLEEILYM